MKLSGQYQIVSLFDFVVPPLPPEEYEDFPPDDPAPAVVEFAFRPENSTENATTVAPGNYSETSYQVVTNSTVQSNIVNERQMENPLDQQSPEQQQLSQHKQEKEHNLPLTETTTRQVPTRRRELPRKQDSPAQIESAKQQDSPRQQQSSEQEDQEKSLFNSEITRPDGRTRSTSFIFKEAITRALAEMAMDDKVPLGTQVDKFILDCEYSGYLCNIR